MELLLLQAYNGALLHVRAAKSSSIKGLFGSLPRRAWLAPTSQAAEGQAGRMKGSMFGYLDVRSLDE